MQPLHTNMHVNILICNILITLHYATLHYITLHDMTCMNARPIPSNISVRTPYQYHTDSITLPYQPHTMQYKSMLPDQSIPYHTNTKPRPYRSLPYQYLTNYEYLTTTIPILMNTLPIPYQYHTKNPIPYNTNTIPTRYKFIKIPILTSLRSHPAEAPQPGRSSDV